MALYEGYKQEEFLFEDMTARVVIPDAPKKGAPLALKTEYWNAFPATEIALLENGFHLCYIKNDNRWGTDPDLDRKARFVRLVAEEYGLSLETVPIGMSCGGLFAIKSSS